MIKEGDKFLCTETYKPTYLSAPSYIKGKIYTSNCDECITDEYGENRMWSNDTAICNNHFTRVEGNKDNVNHPSHYTWLKKLCGIEVLDITRHMNFNLGNAIKYILRSGHKQEKGMTNKQKQIEDLEKAVFYLNDEIKKLKNGK